MRFYTLLFLVILTCLYLTVAQGSYEDCCLKYAKKPSHHVRRMVISYRKQELDGGCNIPATVFSIKRRGRQGRVFCADPKQLWVRELMKKLNKKSIG
ncbi:C-C motif chemokine 21 [Alosa alosa]|uniref:C-C motif chemokine 21 n=1 Tax=Alosa alosa TaxID=278164 RepID=UPI00201533D5|nr:C-C motif chemokine 21 [Alosa alosa]